MLSLHSAQIMHAISAKFEIKQPKKLACYIHSLMHFIGLKMPLIFHISYCMPTGCSISRFPLAMGKHLVQAQPPVYTLQCLNR